MKVSCLANQGFECSPMNQKHNNRSDFSSYGGNDKDFSFDQNHTTSTTASSTHSSPSNPDIKKQSPSKKVKVFDSKACNKTIREIELENIKEMNKKFANLNEWVEELIKTSQCENKNGRDSQMRMKKNKDQIKMLENEYLKNPDWTRAYMRTLTEKTGLREGQIYKWHWDQKKREAQESGASATRF